MPFEVQINFVRPDGTVQVLTGTAHSMTDRPVLPVGAHVVLTDDDVARLKKGFARLRRAVEASDQLGNVRLTFSAEAGFVVPSPVPDLSLKALAVEVRPFFLTEDPFFFPALVKLRSFAQAPDVARAFRSHTKRWNMSAFQGSMGIRIGALQLDTPTVVSTWFNSDYFHSEPQRADQIVLDQLSRAVGGQEQARALLALHLTSSIGVAQEFFEDVSAVSTAFGEWSRS